MKNIKAICCVALVAALAVLSCGDGSENTGEKTLTGKVQIFLGEIPAAEFAYDINTGSELTADYSGGESVSFQWKKDGANVAAAKGGTAKIITLGEPGKYTVTASAKGYKSKTSASVTVKGDVIPPLSGEVKILKKGTTTPITSAQTGEELTAFYDGTETVSFQWFKDGEPAQTYAAIANADYTPTVAGRYTVKITNASYSPKFSSPVDVTGQALITITFDLNGPDVPTNPIRIIAPGEKITARDVLPTVPAYNGFTFKEWNNEKTETGTVVDEDTVFTANATVYARWTFSGGIAYYDADTDTVVHENPMMDTASGFTGTISEEDGTVDFSAGAFRYMWPTSPDGVFNIGDYVYCIVRFNIVDYTDNTTGSDPKAGSGVRRMKWDNSVKYDDSENEYPWLTNVSGTGIKFMLSGAGDTGGFAIRYNGVTPNGHIALRITSITFYKLPEYTVTFNLNGGDGSAPNPITLFEGYTIGTSKFPTNPTKTDYTFISWKNAVGTIVTASTPIMGNWELTAQWWLTADLPDEYYELISISGTAAPVYGFDLDTDTLADYTKLVFKVKIDDASPTKSGRLRAWGPFNVTTSTDHTPMDGMGNANVVAGSSTNDYTNKLLNGNSNADYNTLVNWTVQELEFSVLNALAADSVVRSTTGKIGIAFGIIANNDSNTRNFYLMDVKLSNADGTKTISAFHPEDTELWNGDGATAYVRQSPTDLVTRTILPYFED